MNSLPSGCQAISNQKDQKAIYDIMMGIYDRTSTQLLVSAGLAISAGASPLAKSGNAYLVLVNGMLQQVAAANLPALVGTINPGAVATTGGVWNCYCFFIDAGGTITSAMGRDGLGSSGAIALANMKFPPIPPKKALIGFVLLNVQSGQTFVGGTTALDSGTVLTTANTVYVNTVGDFDSTATI